MAVATLEGVLVNQHLGEATRFQVWGQEGERFRLIEERPAPLPGGGPQRWEALCRTLHDCRAVLVSGIGQTPRDILFRHGLEAVEMSGLIEAGLRAVYGAGDRAGLKGRRKGVGGGCCRGEGGGCG